MARRERKGDWIAQAAARAERGPPPRTAADVREVKAAADRAAKAAREGLARRACP